MPSSSPAPRPTSFLLSPAHCGGRRARLLLNPTADFPLAVRLRAEGVAIGEVFSFLSGLYFRGKLAYARAFAREPGSGIHVIAPGRGLLDPDHTIGLGDLVAMAEVSVALDEPRYRVPLECDVRRLAATLGVRGVAVLLGSIATDKYVEVLGEHLAHRLVFPIDFVGRGDMSRGGLMLRCVSAGSELGYRPIAGAPRHGPRPPRLEPVR